MHGDARLDRMIGMIGEDRDSGSSTWITTGQGRPGGCRDGRRRRRDAGVVTTVTIVAAIANGLVRLGSRE